MDVTPFHCWMNLEASPWKGKINKLKANLGSVCKLANYLQGELSNSILRNTAGIICYITCVNASEQSLPCRVDCHMLSHAEKHRAGHCFLRCCSTNPKYSFCRLYSLPTNQLVYTSSFIWKVLLQPLYLSFENAPESHWCSMKRQFPLPITPFLLPANLLPPYSSAPALNCSE